MFFPGKCTLVFERSDELYSYINPGVKSVGIRIVGDEFVGKLCNKLPEKSIVLTSANVSQGMSSVWTEVCFLEIL